MMPAEMDKTAIPGSPSQTAMSTTGMPMLALIILIRNWFSRDDGTRTGAVRIAGELHSFAEPTLPLVERFERFVDMLAEEVRPPCLG